MVTLVGGVSLGAYRYQLYQANLRELQELTRLDAALYLEVASEIVAKTLEQRLARDPQGALALAELAQAYLSMGVARGDNTLIEQAEERANASLLIAPFHNTTALETLARVASHRHDFMKAIELSDQLVGAGSIPGYEIRISALLALKRFEQARESAIEFLEVAEDLSSLLQMGLVEEALGDISRADRYYRAAVAADTNSSRVASLWSRAILARFFIRTKRLSEAAVVLESIYAFDPNYAFAIGLQGELGLAQGSPSRSVERFERAFELTRDPLYLVRSAVAQKEAGDNRAWLESLDVAIALYRKAIERGDMEHKQALDEALRLKEGT